MPRSASAASRAEPPPPRGARIGILEFPARYDDAYLPDPASATGSASAKRWIPPSASARSSCALREVMRYAYATSPFYQEEVGRSGHPSRSHHLVRSIRARPGRHQGGVARIASGAAAVRRVPVRPRMPRFDRIHGTSGTTGRPDGFRDRARRLGRDRQQPRAHHVGHGHPPRRYRLLRRDLQPVSGLVGRDGRRGALARAQLPVRRRRAGNDGARRPMDGGHQAQGASTARPRTRCAWQRSPPKRASTRAISDCASCSSRANRAHRFPPCATRSRRPYGAKVFDCGTMAEMTPFMSAAGTAEIQRRDDALSGHRLS